MSNDKINLLEPGEFEMRKVFEETSTKNIKTLLDYTTQTREMMRELQDEVKTLKGMLVTRDAESAQLRQQISLVQGILYANGSG